MYSISNLVAGSNHHEVFRRTAKASFHLQKVLASMPACLRMARNVASGMSPGWLGMVVAVERRIEPDFVRTGCLSVEYQAETLQPLGDLAITETRQCAHQVATING